jgi:hypothetical protein
MDGVGFCLHKTNKKPVELLQAYLLPNLKPVTYI